MFSKINMLNHDVNPAVKKFYVWNYYMVHNDITFLYDKVGKLDVTSTVEISFRNTMNIRKKHGWYSNDKRKLGHASKSKSIFIFTKDWPWYLYLLGMLFQQSNEFFYSGWMNLLVPCMKFQEHFNDLIEYEMLKSCSLRWPIFKLKQWLESILDIIRIDISWPEIDVFQTYVGP